MLIGLISIGSPTAFSDLLSLTINGLYSSYFLVCALLLWRRCSGSIKYDNDLVGDSRRHITSSPGSQQQLVWGPWRIPGIAGLVVNAYACIFMIIILFFSFWPQGLDPTPATMNWSCLVTSAVAVLSAVYYLIWAHKTYTGPVVDIEV